MIDLPQRHRLRALWLVAALATIPVAAQETESPPAELRIAPERAVLQVGETLQLVATVLNEEGHQIETELIYLSRARRSLEVSDTGLVTAHAAGRHGVVVIVPAAPGSDESTPALRGRVTIRVPAPPVVSVELVDLPQRLFAGTRLRLATRRMCPECRGNWMSAASWATADRIG